MSYVLSLSGLGHTWPSSVGALPVSAACRKAASSISDVGKYLSLSPAQTEKLIADCCSGFQEEGDAGERTARLAECVVRATSAAAAAAACTLAGAPFLAGVCASVGGFLADRVLGYDTGGKVAFAVGTGICGPSCGFVLAELTEFFSDTIGPLISGIFDTGAANRREHERRSAELSAYEATDRAMRAAEMQTIAAWKASVNRIWDLFEGMFRTATARAGATKALGGISASYPTIAAAMIAAGVPYGMMLEVDIKRHRSDGSPGCEIYGKPSGGSYGQVSGLCPPFWQQRFLADPRMQYTGNAQAVGADLAAQINDFFLRLQVAEAMIATRITTYATMQKANEALKSENDIDGYVVAAQKAAGRAQVAAKQAASTGNVKESGAAAERARLAADTADKATKAILLTAIKSGVKPGERGTVAMKAMEDAKLFSDQAAASHEANKLRRTGLIFVGLAAALGTGAYLYATR